MHILSYLFTCFTLFIFTFFFIFSPLKHSGPRTNPQKPNRATKNPLLLQMLITPEHLFSLALKPSQTHSSLSLFTLLSPNYSSKQHRFLNQGDYQLGAAVGYIHFLNHFASQKTASSVLLSFLWRYRIQLSCADWGMPGIYMRALSISWSDNGYPVVFKELQSFHLIQKGKNLLLSWSHVGLL